MIVVLWRGSRAAGASETGHPSQESQAAVHGRCDTWHCAAEGEKSKLVSLVSAGPANWGGWLPTLERGETVLCSLRNTTLAILFHGDDCSIFGMEPLFQALCIGHHSILNESYGVQEQCTNSPPNSSARKCGAMVCRQPSIVSWEALLRRQREAASGK